MLALAWFGVSTNGGGVTIVVGIPCPAGFTTPLNVASYLDFELDTAIVY